MNPATLRVALLSVITSFSLGGQPVNGSHYFSAEIANDVFFLPLKTDRYFTSGMAFEWGKKQAEKTIFATKARSFKSQYWRINQDLFTPEEIESSQLMPNDRPFASYVILSRGNTFDFPAVGFQLRRQWTAGILGKYSQGGRIQNAFHGMIDFAEEIPGWVHEVNPDLLLNYELEVSKRYPLSTRTTATFNLRGRLGTLYTDLRPEFTIATTPLKFSEKSWIQLSISGANRLVGYNATLTGGLLNRDERYRKTIIPRRNVQDLGATGIIQYTHYKLSGGVRWLSPEFQGGLNHVWAWFGIAAAW